MKHSDSDFTVVNSAGEPVVTSRPVPFPSAEPTEPVSPVENHYNFSVVQHPPNNELATMSAISQVVHRWLLTDDERARIVRWFAGWMNEEVHD